MFSLSFSYQGSAPKEATYGNEVPESSSSSANRSKASRSQTQGQGQASQGHGARSPSPKPITSTPPNVHKPQPLAHASPTPGSSSAYSTTSFPHPTISPYAQNGPMNFLSDAETIDEPYEALNKNIPSEGGL